MRALLVDNDVNVASAIPIMLTNENWSCDTTDLGVGLKIDKLDYDIILLNVMHPGIDGYEVLRWLRAVRVRTPVLLLSDLRELDHRIKGLGFCGDDLLTKPFNRRALTARIEAIVRRSRGRPDPPPPHPDPPPPHPGAAAAKRAELTEHPPTVVATRTVA